MNRLLHLDFMIGLIFLFFTSGCSNSASYSEVKAYPLLEKESASVLPINTANPSTPTKKPTITKTSEPPTSTPEQPTLTFTPNTTPTLSLSTVSPDIFSDQVTPLEFTFPTAEVIDSLDWRPPLYPAPWALSIHDHFYFTRPISANTINWPLWNYRYGGTYPGWEGVVHTGIDIDAPVGTPVRAAAPGKVVWAGYGVYAGKYEATDPYGIAVTLQHDFGFEGENLFSIYAHMNDVFVQPNQIVNTGDILGIVGETGATTGPHLHFEVRWKENQFNSTLNPELWVTPPQGWGVLTGRVMNTSGSFYPSQDIVISRADRKRDWIVRTYGEQFVRSDPYYQENMVLSDLPAGDYIITIEYEKIFYRYNITINPGAVTYFRFQGTNGFYSDLPDSNKFSP